MSSVEWVGEIPFFMMSLYRVGGGAGVVAALIFPGVPRGGALFSDIGVSPGVSCQNFLCGARGGGAGERLMRGPGWGALWGLGIVLGNPG